MKGQILKIIVERSENQLNVWKQIEGLIILQVIVCFFHIYVIFVMPFALPWSNNRGYVLQVMASELLDSSFWVQDYNFTGFVVCDGGGD